METALKNVLVTSAMGKVLVLLNNSAIKACGENSTKGLGVDVAAMASASEATSSSKSKLLRASLRASSIFFFLAFKRKKEPRERE
ncbi:unnamed protein product [Arabidopsis thaliana]|uniref:Uncharacterized protein n=1 Tax=Arabidopsis thaliana TaxID=3702 RepID=A0A654FYK6_ARATH|nr:unnamed protein product [Arabidopsis thaliana]